MMDRMDNLLHNSDKSAFGATGIINLGIVFVALLFAILFMNDIASAARVTYYLNATGGVNIGADGVTSVTGNNQVIPPIITALMDKTGNNSRGALTNDHPHELYNHSRWYFTLNYSVNTKINADPAGKVFVYASAGPYPNLSVRLYDYNPSNGSKTLIGSSPSLTLSGGATNTIYSYNISSPIYIVPLNHRLMLQFDFDPKTHGNTNERIYANRSNSYLIVEETPITYDVTINSTPSSANISAGANVTYNITVNNTGTTNGNYSLSVLDSDTTNFLPSVLGMTPLSVPAGGSNQTTITITANGTAQKDAADMTTITATSIENSIFTNITQITTTVSAPSFSDCAKCHESYFELPNGSNHNQTKNPAAPTCISCHTGFETLHTGSKVNESNTCRICHIQNESGFYERHSSSSDCTSCHFANTTRPFDKNASLFTHDHNLTVEHNFYEYNQSGMPVRTNSGAGIGMFPYYTCTLTCHTYNDTTGVEGKIDEAAKSWLNSSHARSLHMSGDDKMSCARCKSPADFNVSANQSSLISQQDWQGIQCRVCHNLHDRKFPNNTGSSGFPVAFYNSTSSSLAGYPVYEQVADATVLCQNCHSGTSHDSKFAGTHKDTANFTCTNCHMNSSFNNELHKFEVKNTTSGITGCEVCHQPEDHTWPGTSKHIDKADCVACHDQTISRNATGYAASTDNNYVICKDTVTNNWTTCKISHGSAASWPLHNLSKNVKCEKCHGAISVYSGPIVPDLSCSACHETYGSAVNLSRHNQTLNAGAPNCTMCHTGYQPVVGHTSGNRGYIVNESNTCRNCHVQNVSGFYERHIGSSDCTTCHFANTTRNFSLNTSLFSHDHNLTVEHNFYEYNQSGLPVRTNGGIGTGMFPYYTCTLGCHAHGYNATTGVEGTIDEAATSWLNSSHARSLHMSGDDKMSCARCKSPANFNVSANQSSLISQPGWQGIQCRVCHNLHDRKFPNNTGPSGFPVAFYNSTSSSLAGYPVYEQVANATVLCQNCHSGTSHDSKFAGTHKDTANFTCTNCHMNSSFNNELHKFEVKNTTSGITGCEVCHKAEDHTWSETLKHIDKADCVACHDQTVSRNATGYAVSADNSYGIYKDTITNNWTTYKVSHGSAASWPLHNLSKNVKCEKCHGAISVYSGPIVQDLSCSACHATYESAVNLSRHNQTLNAGAPNCTMCHTRYQPVVGHTSGNRGYIVNESNTCRNCHVQNESGFYERHSSSSDCTTCHFANTTRNFSLNTSLFGHAHNLTVEHNFYEYNQSGMPVRTNSGIGAGMFPYYTCTLGCHAHEYNATTGVEGTIDEAATSWLNSSHARSLHMSGDDKMSCARCKSPADFNVSANQSSLISQQDWQGIQCRVCHNLHDRKFPNNTGQSGFPVAFYNSTSSSLAGYPVYEQVANATVLCQNCHSGTSHDSKFAGTHKDTANFTCTNCHMNSSFNNELHKFEVKNTTSGVTGCEVCHKASDHSVLLCKGKIDCVGCHDQTVQRNITGYAVSPDNNYGIYKDPITDNWTTYKVSHGSAVTWPLHNLTSNVTCEKCHGSISVYSGLITQATGSFCERCHYQPPNGTSRYNTDGSHDLHKAKGYSGAETSCDYCHSTGGRNESGHPGTFDNADVVTNGSVSIGIYEKNLATGSDDTCGDVSCHSYNLTQGARVGNSTWNTSTAGLCNQCHSTETSGVPPTGNHTKHFARNVSCSTCHGNNSDTGQQAGHRNGQIEINLTKLALNGSFVSGTCSVYCHSPNPNDLINSTPTWNLTTIVCGDCHSIPPAIFKTRNGNIHPEDPLCDDCHGAGASTGTQLKHRDGAVETFELKQCLSCHEINSSAIAKVDSASFGMHRDVNNTDGGITNSDCLVCHFNITGMFADYKPKPGINVYVCRDCHLNQIVNSTKVSEHIPGSNLSVTTMNCEDCHVNSINIADPRTTINTSLGKALHYGTMTNLVKPTAGTYNTACDNCHNSPMNKTKFGAQDKQIYTPHTNTGKCNMCHIPAGEADTLHNSSLSMPVTVSCKACHTTYASKYKAPDITGTFMAVYLTCNSNNICHRIDQYVGTMDTLARHNINMTFAGTGGLTDTVYLNNQVSLAVAKGASVVITSRVNDTGLSGSASRVGGAEYYIDNDPGEGKGIIMEAVDGSYDAVYGNWENVIATLNTSNLSNGDHKIFVRGVDIGKQWSAPKNATLIFQSSGYINGTVTNGTAPVSGAYVSTTGANFTTGSDGKYSLSLTGGTYTVNASKQPEFDDYTVNDKIVTPLNTTTVDIVMIQKPTGTISGSVTNV